MQYNHKKNHTAGFSLLLAVLVSSLIISVALGVFNLTLKESVLSAAGNESESALYAADSAIECAIYWDQSQVAGGNFNETGLAHSPTTISCDGASITLTTANNVVAGTNQNGNSTATTTINIGFTTPGVTKLCAIADINKTKAADNSISTFIAARGYNTCDVNNPRRVERGLYIRY